MTITHSTSVSRPVWKAAALSGVIATVATPSIAGIADVAGISLDVNGEPIPLAGFATMTLLGALVGYVLAVALNRWSSRPRRTFTITTIVLTAASFIPDLTFPMAGSTRPVLILTHLAAAAIVIPAIAGRLADER